MRNDTWRACIVHDAIIDGRTVVPIYSASANPSPAQSVLIISLSIKHATARTSASKMKASGLRLTSL